MGHHFQQSFLVGLLIAVQKRADVAPAARDAIKNGHSELDPELVGDYRQDELRRMAKASTIYAQREVTEAKQLTYAEA